MTYLLDWAALLVRWLHVITGIAWIGASFYFVWLDNHLRAPHDNDAIDPGVSGELWAVHGGGFYRSQKYRVAPQRLPPVLHWFYWEAYSTWLSGFVLLCLLYFVQAEAYLIDPNVAALSKPAAIAIACGWLVATWLVYDGMCRSPLGRHPRALAGVLSLVLAAAAWGLCHVFSGRGAFMLFGAALGTVMVANVFFVIIPGQRKLVDAKALGRDPDPTAGLQGHQRSVHNTYFTLPVLFTMIGNHYAVTFNANHNWLVLIAISLAGACIRAWFVARQKPTQRSAWIAALPAALGVLILIAVVVAVTPLHARATGVAGRTPLTVDSARIQLIIVERCVPCHARNPTQPGFTAAPGGLALESSDQVRAHLPGIQQQLALGAMPLGNLTGMTQEERATVLMWIGAVEPHR